MTESDTPPAAKPQLDHDAAGAPGGANKPPRTAPAAADLVWIVSRASGLHTVEAAKVDAALSAGARLATDRDLKIAGVER